MVNFFIKKLLVVFGLTCFWLATKNLVYAQSWGRGPQSVADQVRLCEINEQIKKDCLRQFCDYKEQTYQELADIFTPAQIDEVCQQISGASTISSSPIPTLRPSVEPSPIKIQPSPEPTRTLDEGDTDLSAAEVQAPPKNLIQRLIDFLTNLLSGLFK